MSGRCLLIAIAVAAAFGVGCPTVDLGDPPPDPGSCNEDALYYEQVIWPEFIAPANAALSCVAEGGCHDANLAPRSSFRVNTSEPVDHAANLRIVERFLNCGSWDNSPLLTKPLSGVDSHGGGDMFDPGSNSEQVFLQWELQ